MHCRNKNSKYCSPSRIGQLLLVVFLAVFIAACEGPQGPMGPQGPQGPKGEKGDPGPSYPEHRTFEIGISSDEVKYYSFELALSSDREPTLTRESYDVEFESKWIGGEQKLRIMPIGKAVLYETHQVSLQDATSLPTTPVSSVLVGSDKMSYVLFLKNGYSRYAKFRVWFYTSFGDDFFVIEYHYYKDFTPDFSLHKLI